MHFRNLMRRAKGSRNITLRIDKLYARVKENNIEKKDKQVERPSLYI